MKKALMLNLFAFCTASWAHLPTNGLGHNLFYMGFHGNSGLATLQNNDTFTDNSFTVNHRHDLSAWGYGGGAFMGYNIYCHQHLLLGLEASANIYSNRGYHTFNLYNPDEMRYSRFEYSFDMDYSLHLTLRPAYRIDPNDLLYFQCGLAYAEVNVRVCNLVEENVETEDIINHSRESTWGPTLGAGLQHRITPSLSFFAAYEYTRYRQVCFKNLPQGQPLIPPTGTAPAPRHGVLADRNGYVDTNIAKIGIIFTL